VDRSIVRTGRLRISAVMATAALIWVALATPMSIAAAEPSAPGDGATTAPNDVNVIVRFKDDPGKAAKAAVRLAGGSATEDLELIDGMAATVPVANLADLRRNPLVASVEIDGQIHAFEAPPPSSDPEYHNAWGVERIGTEAVHQAGIKGAGVKVAIIDTGLDYVHDVPPNVDPEFSTVYKGGYDFFNGDADPMDDNGHGTHVAGILAAEKNGYLVVGVAPQVDLYALKVLDASGSGEYSGLIQALGWAVDHDIDVVNMSLGGHEPSAALQDAVAAAYAAGVTLVAASGNTVTLQDLIYGCPVAYPAAYDQVIAVSFTGTADKLTGYSCTGPQVDLAAPGDNIISTVPVGNCMFCSANGYKAESGTSMASPHVAGVVALTLSHGIADSNGNGLLADDVKAHLCATAATASYPATSDARYPNWYGCGIVDATHALVTTPPPDGQPGNHKPVAAPDAADAVEDGGPITIDVLANDTDEDAGTTLTIAAVTDPAKGSATIDAGGTVTYAPDPDAAGIDTFAYTVSDGAGGSATGAVTVTVAAVNDPPIASDDTAGVPSGGSVSIDVLANDTDIDGGPLQVVSVTTPTGGTAIIDPNGDSITYTPNPDATGSDAFSYVVDDGAGGTDQGDVAVTIGPASGPPDAADDSATTDEDTPVTIDVLANDSDPDSDPLTITSVTEPSLGTAAIDGGAIVYTPNANASGTDTFDYAISDGAFGSDSATVTVVVAPVNDVPKASSGSVSVPAPSAVAFQLLGSDVETCELGFSVIAAPANGSLTSPGAVACAAGTPNKDKAGVTYTPKAGFVGDDTFTYQTSDGTATSGVATVTIHVTAPPNAVHVGDLDNTSVKTATNWTAKVTIVIHKTNESAGGGALVSGTWSDGTTGSGVCSTNGSGTCSISKTKVPLTTTSVRFTVTNVTLILSPYLKGLNHDPDGDSNGTTIVVAMP
jgi:subtilisin family serine protease